MPPCQSRIRHGSTVYSNALCTVRCRKHCTVQCTVQKTLNCTVYSAEYIALYSAEYIACSPWYRECSVHGVENFLPFFLHDGVISSDDIKLELEVWYAYRKTRDLVVLIELLLCFLFFTYTTVILLFKQPFCRWLKKHHCCRENWCYYHEVFIVIYSGLTKQPLLCVVTATGQSELVTFQCPLFSS